MTNRSSIAALYPEDIVNMWIADGRIQGEPEVFLTFEPHQKCGCADCSAAFEDTDGPE